MRSLWQWRGTQIDLNADVENDSAHSGSAYPRERPDAVEHGSQCGCDICTREHDLRRSGYQPKRLYRVSKGSRQ